MAKLISSCPDSTQKPIPILLFDGHIGQQNVIQNISLHTVLPFIANQLLKDKIGIEAWAIHV